MKAEKRRTFKRITAAVVVAVMSIGICACGKQETGSKAEKKEYVYVAEYIELGGEEVSFYDMEMSGNSLYYTTYRYDETAQTYEHKFMAYSLEDGKKSEITLELSDSRDMDRYTVDGGGNIYAVEYAWRMDEENGTSETLQFLCKYDPLGKMVYEQDITEILAKDENNSWVSDIAVDSQGRIYMTSDTLICLFDEKGMLHASINQNNGWIQAMGAGKDGNIYICYYDMNSTSGGLALTEIDYDAKLLGTTYANFPNGSGNGGLSRGIQKDFLVTDNTRVYEYDMASQNYEEVLNWMDSDINGTYVNFVGALENGKLVAVINDWSTEKTEIVYLTKTAIAELPQKQQLTIGTLYDNQAIQAAAVEFNKKNADYHVNIKTYIDTNNWTETSWEDGINALNADITSRSNCPDILDLSGLNVKQLASKGVLEDLNKYLDKSEVLKREDFLESIVEGYTLDGVLTCIPGSFQLMTVAAKSADVGNEMGWTLEEMMAYAEENPHAVLFDYVTKNSMLNLLLNYSSTGFVDWKTGKCNFDSAEFKQVLEFVNTFPDEYDWESDERSTPRKVQDGDVLLMNVSVYNLQSVQEYAAVFNEPVTYIGMPSEDGGSGCYFSGSDMYGIGARSGNKDAAWAFIEDYLAKEPSNMFSYGLPSNRQHFEEMVEEETKVEYLVDENGEKVLDENGEPIVLNGGSGIGYGDWEYTFHVPTEEEVAVVRELIDVAKPAFQSNSQILNIISEEAEGFFAGQKTVDDVAAIIQSRVQVYVNENS